MELFKERAPPSSTTIALLIKESLVQQATSSGFSLSLPYLYVTRVRKEATALKLTIQDAWQNPRFKACYAKYLDWKCPKHLEQYLFRNCSKKNFFDRHRTDFRSDKGSLSQNNRKSPCTGSTSSRCQKTSKPPSLQPGIIQALWGFFRVSSPMIIQSAYERTITEEVSKVFNLFMSARANLGPGLLVSPTATALVLPKVHQSAESGSRGCRLEYLQWTRNWLKGSGRDPEPRRRSACKSSDTLGQEGRKPQALTPGNSDGSSIGCTSNVNSKCWKQHCLKQLQTLPRMMLRPQ